MYAISEILKSLGIMSPEQSFSFIYNTEGIPLLDTFHKWIDLPFVHLIPSFFIMVAFFFILSIPFTSTVYLIGAREKRPKRVRGTVGCPLKIHVSNHVNNGLMLIGWSDMPNGEAVFGHDEVIVVKKRRLKLYAVWMPIPQKGAGNPEKPSKI